MSFFNNNNHNCGIKMTTTSLRTWFVSIKYSELTINAFKGHETPLITTSTSNIDVVYHYQT